MVVGEDRERIMSNQAQIDSERQFQEDLAKATALSLEQQALDDYRRHKKYGSDYYTQQQHYQQQQQQRNYNTTIAQRRHSEVHRGVSSLSSANERSRTPPAQTGSDNGNGNSNSSNGNGESDLICFASPTSKQPTGTEYGGTPFERLIEDLQRMQTNHPQTALVPVGPAAATPPVAMSYPGVAAPTYATVPTGMGMQLVPYQPTTQSTQQTRPLNHEELQRLYSMPNQLAVQPIQPGFVYYPTQFTAPVVPGSAAYMPPQYPAHPYGYGFSGATTHVDFARPQSTPIASNYSSSQSTIQHSSPATPAPSVANFNLRRATPPVGSTPSVGPALPPQRTGNDLIDLNKDD